jgi:hypothetical protein
MAEGLIVGGWDLDEGWFIAGIGAYGFNFGSDHMGVSIVTGPELLYTEQEGFHIDPIVIGNVNMGDYDTGFFWIPGTYEFGLYFGVDEGGVWWRRYLRWRKHAKHARSGLLDRHSAS